MTSKRERTKTRLAQAAYELFLRQGYEETTVEEIVELAGVSRRTFFRHFPAKVDAAFVDVDELHQRVGAALANSDPRLSTLAVIRSVVEESAALYLNRSSLLLERVKLLRVTPSLRDHRRARVERTAALWAAFVRGRAPDKPAVLADMVGGAIVAMAFRLQDIWADSGGTAEMGEHVAEALGLLEAAFGPLLAASPSSSKSRPTLVVISPDGPPDAELLEKLGRVFEVD